MGQRRSILGCAVPSLLLALLLAGGCAKKPPTFQLSNSRVSMDLPPGWQQGEPRVNRGYKVKPDGAFFFADAEHDDPSGDVMEVPLMGASLDQFVQNLLDESEKMESLQGDLVRALDKVAGDVVGMELNEAQRALQTRVLSRESRTIGDHAAIVVVTEAPRTTITAYVQHEDNVVIVTFGAPQEDFHNYEQLFRDAMETIRVR